MDDYIEGIPPRRSRVRRSMVGRAMSTDRMEEELLPKRLALPIFSSDALSSVAYATEAALAVLIAASVTSRNLVLPVSAAIAVLMAIVVSSYRQTITAYPGGGGAYVVARENIGTLAGLIAAASLLVDYVLTVAVSIAAGAFAITSAAKGLSPYLLEMSLGFLVLLLVANLRGLRESGSAFALPTYLFIAALTLTVVFGVARGLIAGWPHAEVPNPAQTGTATGVGLMVLLRSFASGCSALTGVEAIANGVPAFRKPQARNAASTMTIMGVIAISFFLGVSLLAWKMDARPSGSVSVLAQVARGVFGHGTVGEIGFWTVQITTFAVLVLAANTAFQGFPRLSAMIAQDGFAPRQLQNLGDRLVYSNGIVLLSVLAGVLLVVFDAQVDSLIHLYLLGVFTAFTLSQAGMVRVWRRRLGAGATRREVLPRMAINAVGAAATGIVAVIVIATKFTEGAWMVTVAVPLIVGHFLLVGRHYDRVRDRRSFDYTFNGIRPGAGPVVLFVEEINAATMESIDYANAISNGQFEAIHLPKPGTDWHVFREWQTASAGHQLTQLHLARGEDQASGLINHLRGIKRGPNDFLTVIIPEEFQKASLLAALRKGTSLRLKTRLLAEPGVVITDIPNVSTPARDISSPATDSQPSPPSKIEILVLIADTSDPTLRALDYALDLRQPNVRAIHIALGDDDTQDLLNRWEKLGVPVPLEVLPSPYRDLGGPLLREIHAITNTPGAICNIVIPEAILLKRRHRLLHNQRALYLKRLLLFEDRAILTSVPYQLDLNSPNTPNSRHAE